jgi:hypothetical protein
VQRAGVDVGEGGKLGAALGLAAVRDAATIERTVRVWSTAVGDAGGAGVRRGLRYAVRIRDKRPSCGAAQRWL